METKILHVEDNPDDVVLTAMAFRKASVSARLEVATDGHKAISTLSNAAASPPSCVLLDIKLPSISGLEVLSWIRKQPQLKRLPVIMLTSSLLPGDINQAYDLGANSYLIKPPNLETLVDLAKTIDHYWLRTNTPPSMVP
ncbi:MAG TPA: response regulator [Verrucomicrobiae bacterium]|nr:response regulator [Verrucomicrobiae bacterium]